MEKRIIDFDRRSGKEKIYIVSFALYDVQLG